MSAAVRHRQVVRIAADPYVVRVIYGYERRVWRRRSNATAKSDAQRDLIRFRSGLKGNPGLRLTGLLMGDVLIMFVWALWRRRQAHCASLTGLREGP